MKNNFEEQEKKMPEAAAESEKTSSAKRFLTPEEQKERIEEIKKLILDIQKYKGLVHFTQIANLSEVLARGLKPPKLAKKKPRWGYEGVRGGYDSHFSQMIYFTAIPRGMAVRDWARRGPVENQAGEFPWDKAGQVMILFNNGLMTEFRAMPERNRPYWPFTSHTGIDTDGLVKEGAQLSDIEPEGSSELTIINESVTKNTIEGLVLNPNSTKLARRGKWDSTFEIKSPARTTINRLNRLLKDPDARLVPFYNKDGNVLWPENIPYEKVKEMVAEREKKQNSANSE